MNLFIWTSPANNKNHNIFFKFTVVRKRIVVLNAEVMGPSTMNVMYPQKVRILKRIHHPDVQFILYIPFIARQLIDCLLIVTDISNCTDPRPTSDSQRSLQSAAAAPIYAGAAVGAIIFLVLLFFLVMFLLWKRRRAQSKEDALSRDQIESLLERIVTRSEGDEPYSRKGNSTP